MLLLQSEPLDFCEGAGASVVRSGEAATGNGRAALRDSTGHWAGPTDCIGRRICVDAATCEGAATHKLPLGRGTLPGSASSMPTRRIEECIEDSQGSVGAPLLPCWWAYPTASKSFTSERRGDAVTTEGR